MKNVNTHQAKTHLSRILEDVEHGEVYIISRNGHPIAELHKHDARARTVPDEMLARMVIRYEPTEDLTVDEWSDIE